MDAAHVTARLAPLRGLVDEVRRQFPEVDYLAPGGVLRLPVSAGPVTRLRLSLRREFLHLQSVGLVTADGSDASSGATVTVSSWYGPYEERFSPAALFDWEHPSGTVVHTGKDATSWLEVRFPTSVALREVRLRNVPHGTARRAADLRVEAHTRWRRHVLFDGSARAVQLRRFVAARDLGPPDPVLDALRPVLVDTFRGSYRVARQALDAADLPSEVVREFRAVVNADLLPSRELLWTIHGPHRAFRFWSEREQTAYVRFAVDVAEALREVTPHVSFGFGAVLSVVRDGALIPHDDDLDLVVGFEPHEAATLAEGLAVVTQALERRGYSVRGDFVAHVQVGRSHGGKHVDVFVGIFEGDTISWYPGVRGALDRATMYPTTTAALLGVDCPLPARPEVYLERLYGEGWRTPDPGFVHRWDRSTYADLAGEPATP